MEAIAIAALEARQAAGDVGAALAPLLVALRVAEAAAAAADPLAAGQDAPAVVGSLALAALAAERSSYSWRCRP